MSQTSDSLPARLATLLLPAAYPHPADAIRLIETHISWVLLAGSFAYKVKRPVHYPFVDQRSLERRRFLCEEELRLNRRFAPELYLDVVPITLEGGQARMDGGGEIIEHAVRMRLFDRNEELANLLARGEAQAAELAEFGRSLACIHQQLPGVVAAKANAHVESVRTSLLENLRQLERLCRSSGIERGVDGLAITLGKLVDENAAAIATRRLSGRVKECHGDLHCRNVVRHAGRLVAFDCLEFEPAFRWIDVAEEIAFLFMDLRRRGGGAEACAFLNGYCVASGDYGALRVVNLFAAHRALVRAKVAVIEVAEANDTPAREQALKEYQSCMASARFHVGKRHPTLILMSGFSGSGKTWLAEQLALRISALHLRSDVERKRLAGLAESSSSASGVGTGLYTGAMNQQTYQHLAECAADSLAGACNVIVDATFQRKSDRQVFRELAAAHRVRIVMIRCEAPEHVLKSRILQRARGGTDASEADLAVLERQRAVYETIDPDEGLQVIEADTTRETVLADVVSGLHPLASQ